MIKNRIGENAGKVWAVLNDNREMNISKLKRITKLNEKDLHFALGWLYHCLFNFSYRLFRFLFCPFRHQTAFHLEGITLILFTRKNKLPRGRASRN